MGLLKWLDERTGFVTGFKKGVNWTVPASCCLCRLLPAAIFFAFIIQGITGLFLWAFFAPSAQTAWESVYFIQYQIPFGWLVRGIHHYSAQLLVAMLFFYILMMILHGSYRRPREFVYWSAVVMFLFTLASCLTGDLLMWSLSGYFATMARVSFLQVLPEIGVPLYQLVVGGADPQFGTLTLTRFTVLHIAVFGGGFLVVMLFWKWADFRSRALAQEKGDHHCALACAVKKQRSFWNGEVLACSIACLIFLCAVLLLVFQHSITPGQIAGRASTLPAESYLGAELTSPADPAGSYAAARPEWSFRALYFMSKLQIFSVIGMIFAIFVIPTCLGIWFFALPVLARIKGVHYLIVLVTTVLFIVFCSFTYQSYWDDYRNPEHAPTFLASKGEADVLMKRSIELVSASTGIPKEGALSLLQKDPFIQGPKLFTQHCASCHNFEPMKNQQVNPDFPPIKGTDPTAPNLYGSISADWIRGFYDKDCLQSPDYFGKTTSFAKKGSMIGFVTGRVQGGAFNEKDSTFVLNENGLVYPLIGKDESVAFSILEACLTELVENDKGKELIKKGEGAPKLREMVTAKFADQNFMASLTIKPPKGVLEALKKVLDGVLSDQVYTDLLKNEDNIAVILEDKDIAAFLEDTFLAELCGNGEPIPKSKLKYIEPLRAAIIASCNEMGDLLFEESQLSEIRPLENGKYKGLRENAISDMNWLTCTECHAFYGYEKKDLACDLRGYMSRQWIAGIIADPSAKTYYGKKNDRMPAYHPDKGDALLSSDEVHMLADWMHGQWYRAPQVDNKTRLGKKGQLFFDIEKTETTEKTEE